MQRCNQTAQSRESPRRPARASARGFTLVEVLISAVLLGIGVMALAELHASSIRGVKEGASITAATQIATQVMETLSAQAADDMVLPVCPNNGARGCRANDRDLEPPKACTSWLATAEVPDPNGDSQTGATGEGYRVDTVIEVHPSVADFPNAVLITTSVCWMDRTGGVHELQTQRVLSPGA